MRQKRKLYLLLIVLFLVIAIAIPTYVWRVKGPNKVNNLSIKKMNGEVILSWDSKEDVESYLIYRDNELINSTQNTKYVDQEIDEGQEYVYKVRSVSDGVIGQSNTKKLSTGAEKKPLEGSLELVSNLSYFDGSNNPNIVGEIKNNREIVIKNINANVSFYLGDNFIGSKKTHYQYHEEFGFNYIKSGEKVPFKAYIEMEHNELVSKISGNRHKELRFNVKLLNYTIANPSIYTSYEVNHKSDLNKEKEKYNIDVEIENTGDKEIEETIVCVKFYNKTRGLVGFEKKTIEEALSPGEKKELNLLFKEKYFKLEGEEVLEEAGSFTEIIDSYNVDLRGIHNSPS